MNKYIMGHLTVAMGVVIAIASLFVGINFITEKGPVKEGETSFDIPHFSDVSFH